MARELSPRSLAVQDLEDELFRVGSFAPLSVKFLGGGPGWACALEPYNGRTVIAIRPAEVPSSHTHCSDLILNLRDCEGKYARRHEDRPLNGVRVAASPTAPLEGYFIEQADGACHLGTWASLKHLRERPKTAKSIGELLRFLAAAGDKARIQVGVVRSWTVDTVFDNGKKVVKFGGSNWEQECELRSSALLAARLQELLANGGAQEEHPVKMWSGANASWTYDAYGDIIRIY